MTSTTILLTTATILFVLWLLNRVFGESLLSEEDNLLWAKRDKADNLRNKINKCKDVNKQKQMAYDASQNLSGIARGIKIDGGTVHGVICAGRYVMKTTNDKLKVVCSRCATKLINKKYSKQKLPSHHNGGANISGISKNDYAKMHLMGIDFSTRTMHIRGEAGVLSMEKAKYKVAVPACEVNHACEAAKVKSALDNKNYF